MLVIMLTFPVYPIVSITAYIQTCTRLIGVAVFLVTRWAGHIAVNRRIRCSETDQHESLLTCTQFVVMLP